MELTVLLSIIGMLLTIIGIIITVVMGRQPIHLGKQLQTSKLEKKSASQRQETTVANPEYRTQPYPSDIQTPKPENRSTSQSQETTVANPEYRTQPYPSDIQTPKPENRSTSQSQETTVANPEYRTQPYPSDIISDIDQLPLAQQIQARSNYVGLKVNWRTALQIVTPTEQNRAQLMMLDRGNYPWIYCEIDFSEHPEAKIVRKGHGIWVKGEIVEVRGGVIELVKANVTFD